jgi:hypothetical protein
MIARLIFIQMVLIIMYANMGTGDWSPELAEARRSGRPAATLMLLKWSKHTSSDDTLLSSLLATSSLPPLSPLNELSLEMTESRRTEFVARVPILQSSSSAYNGDGEPIPSTPSVSLSAAPPLPLIPLLSETNTLDLVLSPLMMAGGSGALHAATPSSIDHHYHSKNSPQSPAPLLGALPNQPISRISEPSIPHSSSDASLSHSHVSPTTGAHHAHHKDDHVRVSHDRGTNNNHIISSSHATNGMHATTIHIPTSGSSSSLALLHETDAASNGDVTSNDGAGHGRRASHHRRRSSGTGGTAAQVIGTTAAILAAGTGEPPIGVTTVSVGSGAAARGSGTTSGAFGNRKSGGSGKALRVDASFDAINSSFDGLPTPSSLSQASDL